MSGICGVLHLGDRLATSDDVSGMLAHLARRGPDHGALWCEGAVALGHRLLATTPEAQGEVLPLRHPPSGCTITGDIRIDNRSDLLADLGLDQGGRVIGDGELVLRAYLAWGADCLDRLLGDFAFAIWDAPRARLLCARDPAGMRQLIHCHIPGRIFAFATDAEAVLCHSDVPKLVDEARIADFLEDLEALDLTSTFYRGLHRLPPAHALMLEGGHLRTWRYWQPDPPEPLRLGSDAAYAEAFRDVFSEAVRARLRVPEGKLGAMLSGGMDSGSVAAVASRLLQQSGKPPLPVFSATSAAPNCIETHTIRTAQTIPHIIPHDIAIEDFPAYGADLARLALEDSEPFDGHMVMLRAVYLAAHNAGITVMLDGACGDSTFMADDMVAWRLRRGDVAGAWAEAQGGRHFWGPEYPALPSFVAGLRHLLVPEWLRAKRRDLTAQTRRARQDQASMVAPALAQRVNMDARRRAHAQHVSRRLDGRCEDRRALVTHPYAVLARERYDRVASGMGIEPRDPFLDQRVIAFSLSLPPDQVEARGWPKIILRRAMDGLLPDRVRWRTGKEHVGWRFDEADLAYWLSQNNQNWADLLTPFVRHRDLEVAAGGRSDELAVATRSTLRYLHPWLSRRLGWISI